MVGARSALLGAAAYAAGWAGYVGTAYEGTRLTFLQVGQGDCAVFQQGGQTLIVDCGPALEGYDAGERIVAPKLHALGVRRIEMIVLSHPDVDHIGGLGAICRRFRVGTVVVSATFRRNEDLLAALERAGVRGRVQWVAGRSQTSFGAARLRLDALAPVENTNDGSLTVLLTYGKGSALFTGDLSEDAEARMLRRSGGWHAQVLKVAHHGSATSSSAAFLRAVGATWATVSCGRNNRYGHPTAQALRRLGQAGARILRTDKDGDLTFVPAEGGFVPR